MAVVEGVLGPELGEHPEAHVQAPPVAAPLIINDEIQRNEGSARRDGIKRLRAARGGGGEQGWARERLSWVSGRRVTWGAGCCVLRAILQSMWGSLCGYGFQASSVFGQDCRRSVLTLGGGHLRPGRGHLGQKSCMIGPQRSRCKVPIDWQVSTHSPGSPAFVCLRPHAHLACKLLVRELGSRALLQACASS